MELGLRGLSAIVTGGNRGIGKAVAESLAREGVDLCLVARDAAVLESVAADLIARFNIKVVVRPADLARSDEAASTVHDAVGALGKLDILVNSAGDTKRGSFLSLTDDDWASGYALKLHGAVRMCRAAWPHLEKSRGSVVNIVGVGSRTPSADFTIGGSVNSALINFSKALADLGIGRGVRVNAVNPGIIETDRYTRRLETAMKDRGRSREEVSRELLQEEAVERFGRAEEVGDLVAFLISPVAGFIRGTSIDIDGGATKGI